MESQPNALEMTDSVERTGLPNDGFVNDTTIEGTQSSTAVAEETNEFDELPPLTYIDFMPECTEPVIEGKAPVYADFRSIVDQANKRLLTVPQFEVYKCETLSVKVSTDHKPQTDQTFLHIASNGKNTYLRMLRVWLIPRIDPSLPVQQLAYITVLPDHTAGSLTHVLSSLSGTTTVRNVGEVRCSSFDNIRTTIDKLNNLHHRNPLPGHVVTVETLTFKCLESGTSDKLNTESSVWTEGGATARMYLTGLRIFYVTGQPEFESIGIYDEVPEMLQSMDGLALKPKFATFGQTLSKASNWLKDQKDIRVVGIQTVDVKLDRTHISGPWTVDSSTPGHTENQGLTEARYTKVLRISYVKDKKLDASLPYSSINLTSRMFIPARIKRRRFETFSKTMLHVARWLRTTGTPLFMCETTRYHCSADSTGQGFNDLKPDHAINTFQGQHYLACIRLYFPTSYEELETVVPVTKDTDHGRGCCIS